MALEESQDCSRVARGWEGTSFFFPVLVRIQSRFEDSLAVCRRSGGRWNLGHSAVRLKEPIEDLEDNGWEVKSTDKGANYASATGRRAKVARK